MTDIVERLRNGHDTCDFNKCRVREAKSGCTCAEAADTIERLRADNDYLQKIIAEYQSAYGFFAPRAALGEKE